MATRKQGRPEKWSQELADILCERISLGASLRTACKDDDMPGLATVFRWLRDIPGFREQYARATEERAEAFAEEVHDISDQSVEDVLSVSDNPKLAGALVQAQRLRVDTRKWIMAKMKPKKYGDKLDLTSDGKALPTPIYSGISKKQDDSVSKGDA